MKEIRVLLLNGSPRANGNTALALRELYDSLMRTPKAEDENPAMIFAAEQPVRQHEEEKRRAKALVEQDQALLRVQRQRKQEERHAPQQRRAHAQQ